jgi:hypothetical protein
MAKRGERKEAWFRIIVAIISGIILNVWRSIIEALAIIGWFIVIFTGKRNRDLAWFCEYWNTEMYKYNRYLTFVSNKRPFPFSKMERMSSFN